MSSAFVEWNGWRGECNTCVTGHRCYGTTCGTTRSRVRSLVVQDTLTSRGDKLNKELLDILSTGPMSFERCQGDQATLHFFHGRVGGARVWDVHCIKQDDDSRAE